MELVDEKHVHQCVSTEKADEITSAHDMKTELSEWFATHKGKKWESRGRKEGPLADPISFECAGGVRDKWMDVTVPNISVKVVVSRPQTLAFTKTTATLFFTEKDGVAQRVVQVEATEPLPGSKNDSRWPHLHYGHQYWKLDEADGPLNYKGTLALFSKKSNVEPSDTPENPFEPGTLQLTSSSCFV